LLCGVSMRWTPALLLLLRDVQPAPTRVGTATAAVR
jgi:hypothetical protein